MNASLLIAMIAVFLVPVGLSAVLFRFAWGKFWGPERNLVFGFFAVLSGISCLATAVGFAVVLLSPTD